MGTPTKEEYHLNPLSDLSEPSHMDSEERRKYFTSLNKYRTNLSVMQNERAEGRAEGLAEGLAEGRVEGRAEEKFSVAKAMKADNLSADLIQKYTGLSAEEIAAL